MGEKQSQMPNKVRWGRVLGWSGALIGLEGIAVWLLRRLIFGKLFLFALPWDAPAKVSEIAEASASAKSYFWIALTVIAVIWGVIAKGLEGWPQVTPRKIRQSPNSWLLYTTLALFLMGTIADAVTTFAFFHRDGVDQELHPGIRLVSYSLGRSVGPIVTKLIQFSGVMVIALRWPKLASLLFGLAGSIYLLGAFYNLWISTQ